MRWAGRTAVGLVLVTAGLACVPALPVPVETEDDAGPEVASPAPAPHFPAGAVVAAIARSGRVDAFAVSTDRGPCWATVNPLAPEALVWSPLQAGDPVGPAAGGSLAPLRAGTDLVVLGIDTTGRVQRNPMSGAASWGGWSAVGIERFQIGDAVRAAAVTADRRLVVARGADGLVRWVADSPPYVWTRLDGLVAVNAPEALSRAAGKLDVFAQRGDGAIATTWSSDDVGGGRFAAWTVIGGDSTPFPLGASVTAVSRTAEHIDVFAVDGEGRVMTKYWNQGWSGLWAPVAGPLLAKERFVSGARVTAVATSSTRLDLFAVSSEGRLLRAAWEAATGWRGWVSVEAWALPPAAPVAAAVDGERIWLLTVDSAGAPRVTAVLRATAGDP